ncbi:MAG: peptidoglycan-binding protein, partial [Bacteroidota bacterium]
MSVSPYNIEGLKANGEWSERWVLLLERFQEENELEVTGQLNAQTLNALERYKPDPPRKWILVTGTGVKAKFDANPDLKIACKEVAKHLFNNNYGLITSGWR